MLSEIKIENSKGGNIQYLIDEENCIVNAILYCSYRDPQMLFDKTVKNYIKGNGIGPVAVGWDNEKYYINDYYIGTAKCHPDDVFDVEFGKKLALARVKQKYQNAVCKKVFKMKEYLTKLCFSIDSMDSKMYRKWMNIGIDVYSLENSRRDNV